MPLVSYGFLGVWARRMVSVGPKPLTGALKLQLLEARPGRGREGAEPRARAQLDLTMLEDRRPAMSRDSVVAVTSRCG